MKKPVKKPRLLKGLLSIALSVMMTAGLISIPHIGYDIALAETSVSGSSEADSALAAYYPFNGNANDESGNNNNGTVHGATLTEDRFGHPNSAYSFNGTDQYIEVPSSSSLDVKSSITMSAWIKTNSSNGGIFGKWDGGLTSDAVQSYDLWVTNGLAGASINADNQQDNTHAGKTNVSNNVWNQIIATADNVTKKLKLYVNGVLDAEYNISGEIIRSTPTRILIGVNDQIHNLSWFNGAIDDIRLYNIALSDDEINALYQKEKAPAPIVTALNETKTFNGSSDGVNLGTGITDKLTNNFTVEMWVNPGSTQQTYADIIDFNHSGTVGMVIQQDMDEVNKYIFHFSDGYNWVQLEYQLQANTWQHIAFQREGTTARLYVNGSLVDSGTCFSGPVYYYPNSSVTLGRNVNGGRYFKGSIKSVMLYDYAKDLAGIQKDMNVTAPADYISQDPDLLAYYKLDGQLSDFSGKGNHGSEYGSIAYEDGISGKALKFDGTNKAVILPDNLIKDHTSISISMYFKTTQTGVLIGYQNNTVYSNTSINNWVPIIYTDTNGKLRGEFWNGSVNPIISSVTVNDNKWHNAVITAETNTQSLYLDGVLIGSRTGDIQNLDMNWNQIGTGSTDEGWLNQGWVNFNGCIDEVRIYKRSLSISEIQQIEEPFLPVLPAAPANLSVAARTGSSVTLSWTASAASSQMSGYKIYRDDAEIGTASTTAYKDTGLTPNTAHKYYVKAFNASGNLSDNSNEISAMSMAPSITKVEPINGTIIGGTEDLSFKLIFANSLNASGSTVKVEGSLDGVNWNEIPAALSGPTVYDADNLYYNCTYNVTLIPSGAYSVRYTLTDADGFYDRETVQYTIDRTAPAVLQNVKASVGAGTITVSWNACPEADAVKYKVYRAEGSSGAFSLLATVDGRTNTSYVDTNFTKDATYSYKITAIDKFNQESEPSETIVVKATPDNQPPVVLGIEPAEGTVIGPHTQIIARGEDNVALASLKLQYSLTGEANSWIDVNSINTDSSGTFNWDASVLSGEVYVRVLAYDASGNPSNGTVVRKYTVDTTGPAKVAGLSSKAASTSITFTWQDVPDNDFSYFQVERKDAENGSFITVGKESQKLGMNITGLANKTTYWFRVVAYDKYGNRGVESDELAVTTAKDTTLPVIIQLTPKPGSFKDTIPLSAAASDDVGLKSITLQLSQDKTNWTEIKAFPVEGAASTAAANYDLDVSSMAEGTYYVRGIAVDMEGNMSDTTAAAPFVEYKVDHTPPPAPANVRITDNVGSITLQWNQGSDDAAYRLLRAASAEGPFEVIADNLSSIGYQDTAVTAGQTYYYKVAAIDLAGNVGSASEAVYSNLAEDQENPRIVSVYPGDGSTLPANPQIRVLASDNYKLSTVSLEFKASGSGDNWTSIGSVTLNTASDVASFHWNTTGLTEGTYTLRAAVKDTSGNTSDPVTVNYTLNLQPPAVPILSLERKGWEIDLSWTTGKEDDLAGFRVYKSTSSGGPYQLLVELNATSYKDMAVTPGHSYYYKIEAIDIYRNSSYSEEKVESPLSEDLFPPTAEAGEEQQTSVGTEVQFDGTRSTDNNSIASYLWNFGDGSTSALGQPVHTYHSEGDYTVTLTVTDPAGNKASDTTKVTVLKAVESGVLQVRILDASTGLPIPGASIVVQFADDTSVKYNADSQGNAKIIGKAGSCNIYGYASDYKPGTIKETIVENQNTPVILSLVKGKLIDGQLTVKRMNLEEITAAGINPSAPENQWVYKFEVHLTFTPDKPVPPIIVNGYGDAISGLAPFSIPSSTGTSTIYPYVVPNPGHPEVAPTVYYLVIPGEARWLKEFFEVGLTMTNTADPSTPFVVIDASATLHLPDGLTLMPSAYSGSTTVEIGSLNPGDTKEVKWVIRGDKKGTYDLDADFNGILQPFNDPVKANFKTSEHFKVWGDDALKMHIDAQERADKGSPYHVRFGIENVSDISVYNVAIELKDDTKQNYIYAPNQELGKMFSEIPAGQTEWVDYWLIPSISGTLDLSQSYMLKTGVNDVNIASDITKHSEPGNYPPAVPVLYQSRSTDGKVTLSWDEISGAQGYKIYSIRSDLYMSKSPELVYTAGPDMHSVTLTEAGGQKDYVITTILAAADGQGTVERLKHAITGLAWCNSAVNPVITIDPMQINLGKASDLMITVNYQGYPVKQGTIDLGTYTTGVKLDDNGQARVNITPTGTGDIVVSAYDRSHNFLVSKIITVVNVKNTVAFNSNGGSEVLSQAVDYNAAAAEPEAPTKSGYTFGGWYKDSALTIPYKFEALVTGNITLYAKWNIITGLTVSTTNTNGTVTGGLPSYTYGDKVTLTAAADATYKFVSWTDSTGKVLSTNPAYSFVITQNTSLIANFAANTLFTVTFYNEANQILSTQTVAQGMSAAAPPNPTKPNFTFAKWDTEFTNIQSNLNIHPVFTANPVKYTLTVNGGTGAGTYNASTAVTVAATVPEGKQFGGWKDEAGNIVSYNQTYSFIITRNMTLTAVLQVAPVTVLPQAALDENVTYDTTDPAYVQMYFLGTFTVPTGYQMIECGFVSVKNAAVNPGTSLTLQTAGATIMKAAALNQAGQAYRVVKTTYGAKFYVRSYMTYKNTATGEIVTIYSPNVVLGVKTVKYSVTFNSNGGSEVSSQTLDYNTAAAEPAVPTKTGYTFGGWYKDSALAISYDFKTLVTGDTTLYAKWNIITGLTVSTTNTNGTVTGGLASYTYGDQVTLTAAADATYKFVNWTDSTGKVLSTNLAYSFVITQNTSLTANFAANTLFTVTFYNEANQILSTQTVAQGMSAAAPPNPTKPNFTFVKWDKAYTNVQSDLNIYPVFTANSVTYTLTVNGGTGAGTYNASTAVTVAATVPEGKQFGGWKDEAGNIVSYNQTYTFIITRNMTLTAVLTVEQETVLPQVTLDSNVTYDPTDPAYVQMYFLGTFTVPTGYQMIECGFVSMKNAAVNPGTSLTLQTAGATVMKAAALNQAGQAYRVVKTTYGAKFYVRSYMTYKNTATGEIITIYSPNVVLGVKTK